MSRLLLGAALGATSAFMMDPQQGPRRRALVQEKVTRGLNARRELRFVGGAGAAAIVYAFVRGGVGALAPLALGAALIACAINGTKDA